LHPNQKHRETYIKGTCWSHPHTKISFEHINLEMFGYNQYAWSIYNRTLPKMSKNANYIFLLTQQWFTIIIIFSSLKYPCSLTSNNGWSKILQL
jgi:hypothetical protein